MDDVFGQFNGHREPENERNMQVCITNFTYYPLSIGQRPLLRCSVELFAVNVVSRLTQHYMLWNDIWLRFKDILVVVIAFTVAMVQINGAKSVHNVCVSWLILI